MVLRPLTVHRVWIYVTFGVLLASFAFATETEDNSDEEDRLAAFLANKRSVNLRLEGRNEGGNIALYSTWTNGESSNIVELLNMQAGYLDPQILSLLEKGEEVTGTVMQSEPFTMAGKENELVTATSPDVSRRLLAEMAPTLCGDVRARSKVFLTIDKDKESHLVKASYIHMPSFIETQEQMASRRTRLLGTNYDVCYAYQTDGGCSPASLLPHTCHKLKTRKKQEVTRVCEGSCFSQINDDVCEMKEVIWEEQFDNEAVWFDGTCKTKNGTDQCLCHQSQAADDWENYLDLEPEGCTAVKCDVECGGEPHFISWDGSHFTYGGTCDLVLASTTLLGASGVGLDMHIRTEQHPVAGYSFISNVALRIGTDVLEVMNNGTYFINGTRDPALPATLAGRFTLSKKKFEKCLWNKIHSEKPCKEYELFDINLRNKNQDHIQISDELFMHLKVQGSHRHFQDSTGLLGTYGQPGNIARDGVTSIEDINDFGNEWQVLSSEPMLFQAPRFPQHPQGCIPPAPPKSHGLRKLHERVALEACDHVKGRKKEFCIFDVTMLGDFAVAHTPFYHN